MTDLLAATYLKENIRNMENDNIEVIDASRREMVEAIIAVENMMALVRQQPQKDGVNENAFWMAWVAGESEPLIDSPFGAGFNKESINNLPAEKKIEEILRMVKSSKDLICGKSCYQQAKKRVVRSKVLSKNFYETLKNSNLLKNKKMAIYFKQATY
eukprot:GHVL01005495.1.p2 GENE.GHVL01005495.1~~GHVL01005495.1.p2  ORF type:complete len:157 (+),score=24.86 GHVL01005495.1:175-645(+)